MSYRISSFIEDNTELTDEETLEHLKDLVGKISDVLVESGYANDISDETSKAKSFITVTYLGVDMTQWIESEVASSFLIVMPAKEEDENAAE